ncbi:hypothetical protein I6U48_11820 [Clostridium sp. PL3]|uniref:Uncharacterized protein n=1 Tax=Clostridium thailandense TaxID=2794346 RepID=A0A949TZA1_9CLOT|nr:hypothetical protein [Clostridium thailandense]MBV7273598.1 hypothetical protein [Clostridium thailandense]
MIREMVGLKTITSMLGGRRDRRVMSTTMIGIVGTAVGLGAAYMMRKNKKMDGDM